MVQKMTKRTQVTIKATLLVIAALVSTILLMQVLSPKEQDPFKESNTSQESQKKDESTPSSKPDDKVANESERGGAFIPVESTLDPANLGTVEVPGVNLIVTYVKGIGGFEYEVLRTPSGTRYVEFRSASLAGTKCTNDLGAFASILVNPQNAEQATLAKSVTVGDAFYGLSLPSASCTSDTESLAAYQKSFSDAFNLLKKAN